MTPRTSRKTPSKATASRRPAAALADLREDDRLVGTAEAGRILGLAPKTLRVLRMDRIGPPCLKLGEKQQSRVCYRRSDLLAWMERRCHVIVADGAESSR
jgi:hypothetical protein